MMPAGYQHHQQQQQQHIDLPPAIHPGIPSSSSDAT